MRPDMHKVIVERPRTHGGHSKGRSKAIDFETAPKGESMKRKHSNRKELNENLAPLERWLESKTGRPWDKVYSEACKVIKPSSTVKNHIKVHLLGMVELNTFLALGTKNVMYFPKYSGWSGNAPQPIQNHYYGFYRHPVSGLLCKVPKKTRRNWAADRAKKEALTRRVIDETTRHLKMAGLWYHVKVLPKAPATHDLLKVIEHEHTRERDYLVSKRILSTKELKLHGLTNKA